MSRMPSISASTRLEISCAVCTDWLVAVDASAVMAAFSLAGERDSCVVAQADAVSMHSKTGKPILGVVALKASKDILH